MKSALMEVIQSCYFLTACHQQCQHGDMRICDVGTPRDTDGDKHLHLLRGKWLITTKRP